MIDEGTTSIWEYIKSRNSSPFGGAFLIALLAHNYKLILALASQNTVTWKVEYIEYILYPNGLDPYVHMILIPVAYALLITFAYPPLALFAFKRWKKFSVRTQNAGKAISGEQLLTLEESRTQTQYYAEQELAWRQQDQEKDAEIRRLRELVGNMEQGGDIEVTTPFLGDVGTYALQELANQPDGTSEQAFRNMLGKHGARTAAQESLLLSNLKKAGLVRESLGQVKATSEGLTYLSDNDLIE